MSTDAPLAKKVSRQHPVVLLVFLAILSLLFWDAPVAGVLMMPVKTFITTIHELSHALTCLATGGSVIGMTLVSDNEGHGGLTLCRGGMPLIYTQMGYLGTALAGCLLVVLSSLTRLARPVLVFSGALIGLTSVVFTGGAIFAEGRILQGLMSMGWGLVIGAGLAFCGLKLKEGGAQLVLLFLAVQTALNSVSDTWGLLKASTGIEQAASFTDATRMADLTGIPAFFWSLFWVSASVLMLGATIWWCFLRKRR